MSRFTKVSMNLTQRDIRNTEKLRHVLHTRSNAEAVSVALGVTASLTDLLKNHRELVVRNANGHCEKLVIPGITDEENL